MDEFAQCRHTLRRNNRCLNDKSEPSAFAEKIETPFSTQGVKIAAPLSLESSYLVRFSYLAVLYIRWVPYDNVEPALSHDAVELNEPVERLMVVLPPPKGRGLVRVHPVLIGQQGVQFAPQVGQL